jgi:hypothetical protein
VSAGVAALKQLGFCDTLKARKLPNKLVTEFYTGSDYQIEANHESD